MLVYLKIRRHRRRALKGFAGFVLTFSFAVTRAQAAPGIRPALKSAQSIDIGRDKDDNGVPVNVVINIKINQMQNRAPAGLKVQLTTPENTSSQGGQQTDSSGRVEFRVRAGVYELTVSGPGVEDYHGTIQISKAQSQAMENIVIKSKQGEGQSGSSPEGDADSVSASKFKVPEKAAKEFQAGSKALEQKDFGEAKKRFSNAAVLYPDYAVAYNGMGVAQMATGDGPGARASFQKAVQIDDRFAEAYRNLSLADHNFEEVDELLTKSLQSDPLNAWALTYAAYAELQTQKFDLAITHARAAHTVAHPGLASVHIVAAHAFEATNQPDEALKEYKLYMEEDPNGRDAPRAKQAIAAMANPQPK
jgi:tetratricopeptide (TPR) repeat protein